MSPDYRLFLRDIRASCEKVSRYAAGLSFQEFVDDEKTFDAVMRNLAIIGEAAKQIPDAIRAQYPDVEWRKIARFRDIAIHHYIAVDEQIGWDIVQNKVPELLVQIPEPPVGVPNAAP